MKKHNENQFIDKFRFLNSQESSEEISWSCSDSSDDGCGFKTFKHNNKTNTMGRKRKRGKNRSNDSKNISNLDITIVDPRSERKTSVTNEESPVLVGKPTFDMMQKSPILYSSQQSKVNNNSFYVSKDEKNVLKSPIIYVKRESVKVSKKVRKKLFKPEICMNSMNKECHENARSISPILSKKKDDSDRRKVLNSINDTLFYNHDRKALRDINVRHIEDKFKNTVKERDKYLDRYKINCDLTNRVNKYMNEKDISIETSQSSSPCENSPKKPRTDLVAKVKSYFDNHFSSEASQVSISECETLTPKDSSKSSCEIEISSPRTQHRCTKMLSKDSTAANSFESHLNAVQTRKAKYKKGGLSHRLNALLKKQNASISLWQHERFLAANSNFVIPKQEFLMFRIRNVHFKYGIYLLEILNIGSELFFVIINSMYVNNNSFEINDILKIYEPFKIVNYGSEIKIITNICKFECEKLGI